MQKELKKLEQRLDTYPVFLVLPKMRIQLSRITNIDAIVTHNNKLHDIYLQIKELHQELLQWKTSGLRDPNKVSTHLLSITNIAIFLESCFPILQLTTIFSNKNVSNTEHVLNTQGWKIISADNNTVSIAGLQYNFILPKHIEKDITIKGMIKPIDINELLLFVNDLGQSCETLLEIRKWDYSDVLNAWSLHWSENQSSTVDIIELRLWISIWKSMHCGEQKSPEVWDILAVPKTLPEMNTYIQNILSINQQSMTIMKQIELDIDL